MKAPNMIEDELDIVRVRLYEDTKDMSSSERVAYLRGLAAPVTEEYNLRLVREPAAPAPRR